MMNRTTLPVTAEERLAAAEEILREFMGDVRAVGVVEAGREWPDLLITYNKARRYFERKEGK